MTGKTTEPIPAGAKLLVFKNDRKDGDVDPDYTLHFVHPEDAQPPMRRAEPGQQQPAPEPIDDDIPW